MQNPTFRFKIPGKPDLCILPTRPHHAMDDLLQGWADNFPGKEFDITKVHYFDTIAYCVLWRIEEEE